MIKLLLREKNINKALEKVTTKANLKGKALREKLKPLSSYFWQLAGGHRKIVFRPPF